MGTQHTRRTTRGTSQGTGKMLARRGFTLVELMACVALAGAVGSMLVVADPISAARESSRQLKDATQIRGIMQSMVIWGQNNKDEYPLPSKLDRANVTVAETGRAKDVTANIFSILIWNGSISPEIAVSPQENNKQIKVNDKYTYAQPAKAVKPVEALWDPTFAADFTGGKVGNVSYAHLQPADGRLKRWSSTFDANQAILCSRGPEISSVEVKKEDTALPTFADEKSHTLRVYKTSGTKGMWSGNVAFNDGHVEFIKDHYAPKHETVTGVTYIGAEGKKRPDMAFFDEADDALGENNFLGIFVKAGETRKDFRAIWD